MNYIKTDEHYKSIVEDILENDEFNKIKDIEHHGVTRFDHSVKVSYYSYKISKALGLDYLQTARGGLLHDFFLSEEERTTKDRLVSTFVHPKKAVEKAQEQFNLTKKEADMIRSHMFPINLSVPRYLESWVVSMVDKWIGLMEFNKKYSYQIKTVMNLYVIFLINNMR